MTIEQTIVRYVFLLPTLLLMAIFLPYHGGYQFLGILDITFLCSGAIDVVQLVVQLVLLLVVWLALEAYASRTMDLFPRQRAAHVAGERRVI